MSNELFLYIKCKKCGNFLITSKESFDIQIGRNRYYTLCQKCEIRNYFKDGKWDTSENIDKLYDEISKKINDPTKRKLRKITRI
jgi:predicted nucleic-acid-binding Zn-ribbon protein